HVRERALWREGPRVLLGRQRPIGVRLGEMQEGAQALALGDVLPRERGDQGALADAGRPLDHQHPAPGGVVHGSILASPCVSSWRLLPAANLPMILRRTSGESGASEEMYIWQQPGWPGLRWDPQRLLPRVAEARYRQGRFLGMMSGMGFDLRLESELAATL